MLAGGTAEGKEKACRANCRENLRGRTTQGTRKSELVDLPTELCYHPRLCTFLVHNVEACDAIPQQHEMRVQGQLVFLCPLSLLIIVSCALMSLLS